MAVGRDKGLSSARLGLGVSLMWCRIPREQLKAGWWAHGVPAPINIAWSRRDVSIVLVTHPICPGSTCFSLLVYATTIPLQYWSFSLVWCASYIGSFVDLDLVPVPETPLSFYKSVHWSYLSPNVSASGWEKVTSNWNNAFDGEES